MGSGEFDGGGSVEWYITHGDGERGQGDKKGGRGKDKHPKKGTGGEFIVTLNGDEKFRAATDTSKIVVKWNDPDDSVEPTALRGSTSKTEKASRSSSASKAKKTTKSSKSRARR